MTNEEAIRTLRNAAWFISGSFSSIVDNAVGKNDSAVGEKIEKAVDMAVKALKAQEQLANNSPELDNNFGELISRQAANYKICNACGMIDCDQMDKCKKVFTAQPEKCTETHSCDLISRKMVLALPRNKVRSLRTYEVVEETINVTDIEHLPSAQPETAKRIVGKSRDGMTLWYQCDMCNEPVDAQDDFCRGCGRRLTDG